jgi:NhaP-type Na+/H+ or K+/H+ antiporter
LNELYVSLAAVGGLLLLLGVLGGLLKERTPVSEPLIALIAGVLIGPAVLGWFDLAKLGNETLILEEAALVTLGIALVGVALRLPVGYASGNWRLLIVLLGILMPLMWIVSGLLVYLILGLPFWVAVLIGAIVTPTDPVVASSIVAGGVAERNLPSSLRCAISAESGFNDGLALPFVVLPVLVLTEPSGEVLGHWLTHTILLEIVAGAALAAFMGYAAGKTLRWVERKETMERTSLLTVSLALSLTVLGVTEHLHLNGVLAAFVAGIVFNFAGSSDAKESQEEIQEAISRFFDLPIFVVLGMALPWEGWLELGWGASCSWRRCLC